MSGASVRRDGLWRRLGLLFGGPPRMSRSEEIGVPANSASAGNPPRASDVDLLIEVGALLADATTVDDVADPLLARLAKALGAEQAVFLRADRERHQLSPIAAHGLELSTCSPVSLEATHVAVQAFRSAGSRDAGSEAATRCDPVCGIATGTLLAVPLTRPQAAMQVTGAFLVPGLAAAQPAPLGVLLFAAPRTGRGFTADHRRLAETIGAQVGTALHHLALIDAVVERRQWARELKLAQELQLKLLPPVDVVRPEARAAAHVLPAEQVGGDFYHLVRLDATHTGVLVGDVSGHGFPAALMMAMALSAAAIHLQGAFDPSVGVERIARSLRDELRATDMSVALCYAVIDAAAGEVRYANAGHPFAYLLDAAGTARRLGAVTPPLGLHEGSVEECVVPWSVGDRLLFFTDGVVDARNAVGRPFGESAVLATALAARTDAAEALVSRLIDALVTHAGAVPFRDDCMLLVVDRT